MTWIIRPILALAICVAVVGSPAVAGAAEGGAGYVKYYTVAASYNDAPEDLTEIATRFLGDDSRSGDIYSLNVGREQPDGSSLADPTKLHAGWVLVMPWDAIGTGIQYGVLPGSAPAPVPGAPTSPRSATPPATSTQAPSPAAAPSQVPTVAPPPSAQCATAAPTATTTGSDWAQTKLAVDNAWPTSRGKGQLIAVLDSGVDAGVPQLNEHVLTGTDVVTAGGRGDVDCLGSGTAMAGLIVGQPDDDGTPVGVAPDATVVPIRVVGTAPVPAQPSQQAAAIKDAVTAGATVIALGQYLDITDSQVTAAISDALTHDAVVVVEAPTSSAGGGPPANDAVLRVGGVQANGQQPQAYQSGAVDVVAPGVGINSLGIGDTGTVSASGTQLAVAFVAGTVALVRAANPKLDAKQVGQRIRATASKMGGGSAPDPHYGWGMLNPAAAVTSTVTGGSASPAPPRSSDAMAVAGATGSGGGAGWLLWFLLIPLLGGGFLILRYFLRRDPGSEKERSGQQPARGLAPMPIQPAPRPVFTPSASALKAATSLGGVESHWTDNYRESGVIIEGDEDPTHYLGDPVDPYGDL